MYKSFTSPIDDFYTEVSENTREDNFEISTNLPSVT